MRLPCDHRSRACLLKSTGFLLSFFLFFSDDVQSDLFFFIANNHTTFSSFLATPGDTYSRNGRRLTYLCVNCFTLFVVIVLKSTIPIPPTYKKIITIFFVSPAIIFVRKSFFYMLACPCIDRDAPQPSFVTRTLMSTGATSAYLYGGLYLGVLLVAALFTPGKVRKPNSCVGTSSFCSACFCSSFDLFSKCFASF